MAVTYCDGGITRFCYENERGVTGESGPVMGTFGGSGQDSSSDSHSRD
jgi:hypothetical protein